MTDEGEGYLTEEEYRSFRNALLHDVEELAELLAKNPTLVKRRRDPYYAKWITRGLDHDAINSRDAPETLRVLLRYGLVPDPDLLVLIISCMDEAFYTKSAQDVIRVYATACDSHDQQHALDLAISTDNDVAPPPGTLYVARTLVRCGADPRLIPDTFTQIRCMGPGSVVQNVPKLENEIGYKAELCRYAEACQTQRRALYALIGMRKFRRSNVFNMNWIPCELVVFMAKHVWACWIHFQ